MTSAAPLLVEASTRFLPTPEAGLTIPVGVVFIGLALFWIARKLITLALVAVIVAVVVFAYQGGAFDHFVDRGKQIIDQHSDGA